MSSFSTLYEFPNRIETNFLRHFHLTSSSLFLPNLCKWFCSFWSGVHIQTFHLWRHFYILLVISQLFMFWRNEMMRTGATSWHHFSFHRQHHSSCFCFVVGHLRVFFSLFESLPKPKPPCFTRPDMMRKWIIFFSTSLFLFTEFSCFCAIFAGSFQLCGWMERKNSEEKKKLKRKNALWLKVARFFACKMVQRLLVIMAKVRVIVIFLMDGWKRTANLQILYIDKWIILIDRVLCRILLNYIQD